MQRLDNGVELRVAFGWQLALVGDQRNARHACAPSEEVYETCPGLVGAGWARVFADLGTLKHDLLVAAALCWGSEERVRKAVVATSLPIPGVSLIAESSLPTRYGTFRLAAFQVDGLPTECLALAHGTPGVDDPPLVRLHSECLTGDAFGSLRCDCGEQLGAALALIAADSRGGLLLYLRQEGRGIGIANKIRAYALQDAGLDTVEANLALGLPVDGREYASAAAVLRFLGMSQVRLLTNNPAKAQALEQHGVQVVERQPLEIAPNPANAAYLRTKAERMGHLLAVDGLQI
jgi:GTP cyclohydrolase II